MLTHSLFRSRVWGKFGNKARCWKAELASQYLGGEAWLHKAGIVAHDHVWSDVSKGEPSSVTRKGQELFLIFKNCRLRSLFRAGRVYPFDLTYIALTWAQVFGQVKVILNTCKEKCQNLDDFTSDESSHPAKLHLLCLLIPTLRRL